MFLTVGAEQCPILIFSSTFAEFRCAQYMQDDVYTCVNDFMIFGFFIVAQLLPKLQDSGP